MPGSYVSWFFVVQIMRLGCQVVPLFYRSVWKYMNFLVESCGSCGCAAALPKLETLVLTNNRLSNLVDLDHLAALLNLQNLCLLDNAVTKRPNYRLHLIHKLPKLRLLDFKKVKLKVHPKHQFFICCLV